MFSSSDTSEIKFKEIESYLSRFDGGEVTLSREYFDRGLAIIYLNNPRKRNAVSGKMMIQLRQCIEQLEQWQDGKAVLLCGKGTNFCSGGDLDMARSSGQDKRGADMSHWMQDTLQRLQNLPMVSVCLTQGPTIGGGAEISVFCDFIVTTEDVKYGFVHGKMGITTAWGAGTRLVEKVGAKKALNLLLTSQILSANECVEYGIADHIVPMQDSFAHTLKWLEPRLQHNTFIIRSFKQIVNRANRDAFQESLKFEKEVFSLAWGGEANQAALDKNIKHVNTSKM